MTLSASDAMPFSVACSETIGRPRRTRRIPRQSRLTPLCVSLFLIFCFLHSSSAQPDPVKNFCRRFGHQTAVIDRKLYIDGGFMNYNPLSQYPANYSNTGLHYHDLDTPGAGRMPQLYANLTKNATIPTVNGGTLWADDVNKRFYLFAGEYYQQPPSAQFTLWSYDTIYNRWESFGSPAQDNIAAVSYGAGVSVSETGNGYYYGGWKSNSTMPGWDGPPKAMSGMVKYSMDSNAWSTDPGPDLVGRAEGAMVFIPIGDGGMLVYFGGVQDPSGNGTWVGQPMKTIFLYDVLSSKWYTQEATGDVPQMRRRFCAGATWAPDQSSYNIYLYGGAGMPPDTSGFDDIYTLSIPSFKWVKMFPLDGNETGIYPHHSLTCNVIDNAQMIVLGGTFPTSDRCDVETQYGLHNMDMGEQNDDKAIWQIFDTNLTGYAVPNRIISAIGGSAGGGATKTAPADGFSNPDLRVLMTRKASIATRTPTRAIPTSTGTPEQDSPLSTSAIAGIAIGGAVALAALVTLTILLIRRRRRQHNNPPDGSSHAQTKSISTSSHGWCGPHTTTTSSHSPPTTYSPTSPYPHSPFLHQHHQHGNGYHPPQPSSPSRTGPRRAWPTSWWTSRRCISGRGPAAGGARPPMSCTAPAPAMARYRPRPRSMQRGGCGCRSRRRRRRHTCGLAVVLGVRIMGAATRP
ncbi:hypothetical protein B0I37DRAFT_95767 [Chaetomium sp. MPI-CAGE-AT-0009]|nr:hypothetical protein B0I37DRAFT_95767 [Chaetomium sp. MPI-CAGE-AT-0009]